MFNAEYGYARMRRKSKKKAHRELNVDQRQHWRTTERGKARTAYLPQRSAYAQNQAYLELCNPGWDMQWRAGFGNLGVVLPALFIIWSWYGHCIHPLLFDELIFIWHSTLDFDRSDMWFGWLVLFPFAAGCAVLLYGWFYGMGMRTSFFTFARGRVRFNRITRKVYVLRPAYYGGNKIFDWDNLVALMRRVPEDHPMASQIIGSLVLYQPPTDPGDWLSEDAIFAGPSLYLGELQAAPMWEYIRLYMEEGPTIDAVPQNPPDDFRQIPRFLPERYFTYCGMPSAWQYGLEQRPGLMETTFHMMSQVTCTWSRFPPEWESDSGMGEPEDRPVQTGAVMTALVYRAQGRLSKQDEVAFLTHWGTEEALAEAMMRPD